MFEPKKITVIISVLAFSFSIGPKRVNKNANCELQDAN